MDRLPPLADQVARLVERLGALPGVRVERISQDRGRWVVHVACANAAVREEALAALGHLWPRSERTAALHVDLRVG